ncbi:DNA polymerase III subunit delta [Methylococcus geothermalis]|uniref:DNA polymerase III subunit delta n=1 Tax=Methylococcus geothermalis TaxID=2681310 RepID=A0A858Q8L0_9GAMM|nr:DNA polymerase III subunit delta [Methylococcus geothermalis]QJD30163.1 DNA polymerase III subunit delta [Methylococcus geothermalis]
MKLRPDQLAGALERGLAPVYVFSGDEPLQLGEAADAVRAAARERGYVLRELFHVEPGFSWGAFLEAGDSVPLFGDLRILDLRLNAKPDKEGAAALLRYLENPPSDAILILTLPRLTKDELNAAWARAADSAGVLVQVWPLEGRELIGWLDRRLNRFGMLADQSGLRFLAARVEGNLLAAAQEIEKLRILYGAGRIEDDQILSAVSDCARYDVFDVAAAMLEGRLVRTLRILRGLEGEGVAPLVVLWAVARELRSLAAVQREMARGQSVDAVLSRQRLVDKRKDAFAKAARRLSRERVLDAIRLCTRVDRMVKGLEPGDPWVALADVCLCVTAPP